MFYPSGGELIKHTVIIIFTGRTGRQYLLTVKDMLFPFPEIIFLVISRPYFSF